MCVPSDEELDLEEDESGTGQKRGMRASCMYRPWVEHWIHYTFLPAGESTFFIFQDSLIKKTLVCRPQKAPNKMTGEGNILPPKAATPFILINVPRTVRIYPREGGSQARYLFFPISISEISTGEIELPHLEEMGGLRMGRMEMSPLREARRLQVQRGMGMCQT